MYNIEIKLYTMCIRYIRHNMICGLWPSTPLLGNSERLVNLNPIVCGLMTICSKTWQVMSIYPTFDHGTTCLRYAMIDWGKGLND